MFKKILIGLVVVIVAFMIIAAMQPSEFRVTRGTTIAAPPAAVFAEVNDLHRWQAWSPWAKLDPNAKNTFDGPSAGNDASFAWAGNSEVGEGRMTIVESRPNELIRMKLEFYKPFAGTSSTEFTFKPEGDRTAMTWTMLGQKNFVMKAFSLFMNCDKMMGGQFEQGFENLKKVVEPAPKTLTQAN